jgi:murein DD-endopeptidase MepM/ murein hydrolase activator NlpD
LYLKLKLTALVLFLSLFVFIYYENPRMDFRNKGVPGHPFINFYPELDSFLTGLNQHHDFFSYKVKKNSSLYGELLQFGFTAKDIKEIQKAAEPYFNLTKLLPNTPYRFLYDSPPLVKWSGIEFKFSSRSYLTLQKIPSGNTWKAQLNELKMATKIASFSGVVSSSLWKSAEQAQMDAKLIADLTEIFAWQIDFSRQVNENDSWRLVVEQEFINNQPVGWGKILAAEYNNGTQIYEAYFYDRAGISGYFAKDGKSATRTLLRTPIEFARISSGFSLRRFHPQLKIVRPHLGVDYSAPKGTPIRSIGDGKVTEARYTISGGKTLTIEHNSVYKTRYMHLNNFAAKLTTGNFVKQGQVIGYVGSTGLSTGPHLHFEFYERNVYRDPLKVVLPPSKSVPTNLMRDFQKVAGRWIAMLPSWPRQIASTD